MNHPMTVRSADSRERTTHSWGTIDWAVSATAVPDAAITVGIVEIAPGCSNDLHHHDTTEEVLVLVSGSLDHTVDDEVVRLEAGDVLHVPPGHRHQATNVGTETARMIVAYPTGRRDMHVHESPEETGRFRRT